MQHLVWSDRRFAGVLLLCLAIGLCQATTVAQTVERVVTMLGSTGGRIKPNQLALSPSGTKIAFADQNNGRISVLGSDGVELWTAGQATPIDKPQAVCFTSEDDLVFSVVGSNLIFRVTSQAPYLIDTLTDLAKGTPSTHLSGIDRILRTASGDFLILDRSEGNVLSFSGNWEFRKRLIGHGQGKGKVWKPNDLAMGISESIVVTDAGNFPVQTFAPTGQLQFVAMWSSPDKQQSWEAAAVAVDLQEIVWVADVTHGNWRLFDGTGNLIKEIPFQGAFFRPISAVSTSDGRLVIADQQGSITFMSIR